MRLKTNYESMTNEELFKELLKRMQRKEALSDAFITHGLKIQIEDRICWLLGLTQEKRLAFSFNYFDFSLDEPDLTVSKEDMRYREVLIKLLQANFQVFRFEPIFEREVTQQELLGSICK